MQVVVELVEAARGFAIGIEREIVFSNLIIIDAYIYMLVQKYNNT